jgi:hypothetical protein
MVIAPYTISSSVWQPFELREFGPETVSYPVDIQLIQICNAIPPRHIIFHASIILNASRTIVVEVGPK